MKQGEGNFTPTVKSVFGDVAKKVRTDKEAAQAAASKVEGAENTDKSKIAEPVASQAAPAEVKQPIKPELKTRVKPQTAKEKADAAAAEEQTRIAAETKLKEEQEAADRAAAELAEKNKVQVKTTLPSYLSDEEEPEAEKEPVVIGDNKNADVEGYKKRIAELEQVESTYKAIENDPFVSSYLQWKAAGGKDINEFSASVSIPSLVGGSDEEKYQNFLKIKYPEFGAEDIEEAVSEFKTLSKIDRIEKVKSIEKEYAKMRDEKLNNFTVRNKEQAEQVQRATQFRDEKVREAAAELRERSEKLKGTSFYGYVLQDKDVAEIEQAVMNRAVSKVDDKGNFAGYDISKSIEEAVRLNDRLFKRILKENYLQGMTAGEHAALDQRKRPAADSADVSLSPQTTKQDAKKSALDNFGKKTTRGKLETSPLK